MLRVKHEGDCGNLDGNNKPNSPPIQYPPTVPMTSDMATLAMPSMKLRLQIKYKMTKNRAESKMKMIMLKMDVIKPISNAV
jgi:hypothetical protein